ncbi:MAG: DUF222 domain-containing protein, partial [Pseudonocardiaceae bacterium]
MFDTSRLEWPPPPVTAPPEEVIDCLVEDFPGVAEPVRWSEYFPDGMLADLLVQPTETDPAHREFETLERVGGWERVIAWAQARQIREMTSFMDSAQARNKALGACDSQAHDSAVAEVGLMLTASARTAACRVGDAWSLCTRLPATLAALESGRITLVKARILDAETLNLSEDHIAAVEERVLAKAPKQTPGQLRAAIRRAVLVADPTAARKRAERTRRERGVQLWPEPDGMATLSAYLPAADAVGVFAVLDEHARHAGVPGDERGMDARRADALVDLVLTPTGFRSQGTSTAHDHTTETLDDGHHNTTGIAGAPASPGTREDVPATDIPATDIPAPTGCRGECGRCRRGGVDVRVTIPYTALLGADDLPGELAGYGPIPAAVARDLAAGGTWRRILTDPVSGRPLD